METYEWQKNKAVVDRLYYSERILENTTFYAGLATMANLLFIKKNYFPHLARARIPKIWMYWAIFNSVCIFVLLKPLTREEIALQWRKRKIMGKWLYSLYHLDPIEKKVEESH